MSTIVYQNIQSYFDEPRSLSLKLNSSKPKFSQFLDLTQKSPISDSNTTGWSCIQALSNASDLHKETVERAEVYVHPLVKRSASMLSEKSLEMCTENLGSETGTNITEEDIFSIPSSDSDSEDLIIARERRRSRHKIEARKAGYENLPPPLTTICGANSIRVQPHRESGRLVMIAVSASPRRPSIHAERRNGRLTMSLLEEVVAVSDEEDNEETECCECDEERGRSGEEEEGESAEEEEEGEGEGEDDELNRVCLEEDKDGRNVEVGGKFGIGEFQRPSRCSEGGHGSRRLVNWEPFWVAT